MFVPGENFFSAALKKIPDLIEDGVRQGVILATPTTLISLLKSVSYGWRQERLAANAEEISNLARDLYDRLAVLGGHFDVLGRSLKKSVENYNSAVGALESRVLPQARRFQELGVSNKEGIKRIEVLDTVPRALQAPELLGEIESPLDKTDLL
jgi:DNA recombination protein RmuC